MTDVDYSLRVAIHLPSGVAVTLRDTGSITGRTLGR